MKIKTLSKTPFGVLWNALENFDNLDRILDHEIIKKFVVNSGKMLY